MANEITLTQRQTTFVRHVVDGVSYIKAYALAGYTPDPRNAFQTFRSPMVAAAIRAEMMHRLQSEDAPAARRLLRSIVDDVDCDKKLRVDCAKTLLSRGGYVEPKAIEAPAPGTKDPSEMTGSELDAMIDRMRTELRQRETKTIDITPQPIDPWDE